MDTYGNIDYMCGWNKITMEFVGIWPRERKWNKLSSYKVLLPVSGMLCFVCAPQTANLFFIWGDFDEIIENLSMANITISITLLKIINIWSKGKPLASLLTCITKDFEAASKSNKKDQETIREICDTTRTTSIRSTIFCGTVVAAYIVLRYFSIRRAGRQLLFRAYFPYDTEGSPGYELTVISQFISALYAAITYTAVDTFIAMLVLHVCGQLSNLRRELKELRADTRAEFRMKLQRIVQKHEYLSRFAESIEDCFNVMLLVQMIGCTIQLCFQCFQALMSFDSEASEVIILQIIFLFIYVLYVLLHLYLYCYVGEKLLNESTEIVCAAYDSMWYEFTVDEAKLLLIIMCRAKTPLQITAGRFCAFTLELFSEVLKRSMGYISVLYAMKSKI